MAKHYFTPGPWRVSTGMRGVGNAPVSGVEDFNSYAVANTGFGPQASENARLIAAAPELLRTLRSMLLEHDALVLASGKTSDRWPIATEARDAIARATG